MRRAALILALFQNVVYASLSAVPTTKTSRDGLPSSSSTETQTTGVELFRIVTVSSTVYVTEQLSQITSTSLPSSTKTSSDPSKPTKTLLETDGEPVEPATPNWEASIKDKRITFEWCKIYNETSTCGEREILTGVCYDLSVINKDLSRNISAVGVSGGQCVMWSDYDCLGKHTGLFVGRDLYTDHLCKGMTWASTAVSIKCCKGEPGSSFCNEKKVPRCKGS